MKTTTKLKLLRVVLVALTIWPLLHLCLVEAFDVNPWKLAGWGMYSAPQLPGHLRIFGRGADGADASARPIGSQRRNGVAGRIGCARSVPARAAAVRFQPQLGLSRGSSKRRIRI